MSYDSALRPTDWDEYIGQQDLKERLQISIDSAITRGAPLDHVLLYAGPGTGKTTIAHLIADEMMQNMTAKIPPFPQKVLHAVLMEVGEIIFIDEAHRLPKKDQEMLLPVLEDRIIQFENGSTQIIPKQFTIIAATTELNGIIKPLRDRFIHKPKFKEYSDEDMAAIVTQMCGRVGLEIDPSDAMRIGIASAGVPRQAKNLVLTARDIMSTNTDMVLEVAAVTPEGFTEDHLDYLRAMYQIGGTAGSEVLSNFTNQPKDVLMDLEKLLLKRKCIEYTSKGRSMLMGGKAILDQYGYEIL